MRYAKKYGFTLVEIIVILVVLSILVGVTVLSYGSWKKNQAYNVTKSEVASALLKLQSYNSQNSNYPPNLAGTEFTPSNAVALKMSTNAPSIGVYQDLTADQNAQLFLNVCNAAVFSLPYNTSCGLQGNKNGAKVHVKGTQASNAIWDSPVDQTDMTLNCGNQQAACDQALADMIAQFTAQGGVFPVVASGSTTTLPEPTLTPNGPANKYCLEGRSVEFPDVVYYNTSGSIVVNPGECPTDAELHYYP